jgi:hypothetical protein
MTETGRPQQDLLDRFAEALDARYDHVIVTHTELSAAWPGNPDGPSSLQQLLQVIGRDWTTDHREGTGDYVFRLVQNPAIATSEV